MDGLSRQTPHLLYIEDDEAYSFLVGKRLRRAGFQITLIENGEAGLAAIERNTFDLVLVDYHLPDCDGLEVIARLAKQPERPPIIIVSAEEDLRTAVTAMRMGAEDYIVKSTQHDYFDLLFATIDRVLAQRKLQEEKRLTEAAFWRQQELLRNIIDNIPNSIFWKDRDGRYQGCNAAFCHDWGLTCPDEVINLTDFQVHTPEQAEAYRNDDRRIMETGEPLLQQEQDAIKAGEVRVQLVSKVPLRDRHGEVMGVLGIHTDITERKEMERANFDYNRALQEKNRELERSNEEILRAQKKLVAQEKMASLGTMAAGIAHEIRNPLNFIQNMSHISTEYLRELAEVVQAERKAFTSDAFTEITSLLTDLSRGAEVINKHGIRAARVVQSMTELAGGGTGRRTPMNLNALLEEYLQLVRDCRPFDAIEVERDFDESVGQVEVMGHNMGRVIINLLNNAVDAMSQAGKRGPGRLGLRTRLLGERVEICIRDNGHGIPAQNLERIFDPFFTTKPSGEGHIGLGLAMCYEIVVLEHGGDLKVHSREGDGAEFIIRLPRRVTMVTEMPERIAHPQIA